MSEQNGARRTEARQNMLVLFLINLLVAFLWSTFVPLFSRSDFVVGLLIGLATLSIVNREYGRRALYLFSFVSYVIWQIIVSNVALAWTIVQPRKELNRRLAPGIVEIPLSLNRNLETMLLASVITLTPGTITVDLGQNDDGQQVLYVHNLILNDPSAFRQQIKEGFEARILRFAKGEHDAL